MCLRHVKADVIELAEVLASREHLLTIEAKPGLEVLFPRRSQIGPTSFLAERRNDKLRSYHAAHAHRGRKVVASVTQLDMIAKEGNIVSHKGLQRFSFGAHLKGTPGVGS